MSQTLASLLNEIWYSNHPARWLLWPLALLFRAAVWIRRQLYQRGMLKSTEFDVPVIVVGNLSVGGTGKTPLVIWLARELRRRGLRVGVVTRGYRGKHLDWPERVNPDSDPAALGDEAVLLARRTECPVVAGPDRVAAVAKLLAEVPLDLVLADDGLQHYRLARAFEIVVVDGERGLGNGLCLPAGPLREPPSRLRQVDAIVVNTGDWGHAGVFRGDLVPTRVVQLSSGTSKSLADFRGQPVHAVAGIGHPARFFAMLDAHGLLVDPRPLTDHADMQATDLSFEDLAPVLVTEKDAVKCGSFAHERVWCVVADFQFRDPDGQRFMRLVQRELGAEAVAS